MNKSNLFGAQWHWLIEKSVQNLAGYEFVQQIYWFLLCGSFSTENNFLCVSIRWAMLTHKHKRTQISVSMSAIIHDSAFHWNCVCYSVPFKRPPAAYTHNSHTSLHCSFVLRMFSVFFSLLSSLFCRCSFAWAWSIVSAARYTVTRSTPLASILQNVSPIHTWFVKLMKT